MKSLKYLYLILFAALFIFGGFLTGNINENKKESAPAPNISADLVKVIKVVDGDTIKVLINNKEETVRLVGIDTPEVVDPRTVVECFGREASDKAKEILSNKQVKLESDSTQGERDKYQRLLRYIFLEDGTNFNKLMISEGYAFEYTYNSNPYKYQKEFEEAEKSAREKELGLWAKGVCDGKLSAS